MRMWIGRKRDGNGAKQDQDEISEMSSLLTLTFLVWTVQAEAEERERQQRASVQKSLALADEVKARKEAMRREAGLPLEK